MKIWQRYIFGRLFSAFVFFLFCFFILYITIDFSIHGAKLLSKNAIFLDIGVNYLCHFAKFTGLFFSLSLLLAMLRTLLDLNAHREIVALQTAGLSTKKLLSPFYFLAFLLLITSYANFQWISPALQIYADNFTKSNATHPTHKEKVFSLVLEDGTELVYQIYDAEQGELFDVFWIRSFHEIWHMKTLKIDLCPVQASFADRLIRKDGRMERADSFDCRLFPELQIERGTSLEQFIPFENRSLTTLWRQAFRDSSDQKKSAAHLHHKLALSVIPFFLIFAFAPFALRFSRNRSSLLFIACSLLVFIGLMTLLDALLILAENQALSPGLSIWTPFAICAMVSYYTSRR